jgi:hypothetical protein
MAEQPLPGGAVTAVSRVGNTVRRAPPPDPAFVRALLRMVDTVLWWQDRCWRGILAKAEAGEPAMIRLRDSGAAGSVRGEFDWVTRHRAALAAPLR